MFSLSPWRTILAGLAGVAMFPALLRAQATVTIFSSYNFENIASFSTFFGATSDSSGHGHGFGDHGVFDSSSYTSTNLAPSGGSYAFGGTGYGDAVIGGSVGQSTNWGFELLIKNPSSNGSTSSGTAVNILSVGSPGSDGMAILYDPVTNKISAVINGGASVGTADYVPGEWNSVALVNDGTNTTLWVNYVTLASVAANPSDPNSNWHMFVNSGGGVKYTGLADNVNVFTFTGTFTAANLSAIPEPADVARLAGLACFVGAMVLRSRSRRRHA